MPKNPWIETFVKRGRKGYYPSIPASEEILMFEKLFKKLVRGKRDWKVLVLGATPFLRDIGLKYGCQVVAVDISIETILKMNEYMKYRDSNNEIVIKGNWLSLPIEDNYFDVVMADFSFNNVPAKAHHQLFRELARLLKQNGFFLTRQRVYIPEKKLMSFSEITRLFRDKKISWRDWKYDAVFYSNDLFKRYNGKTKVFLWEKYFQALKKAYQKGEINKKEFLSMWCERNKIVTTLYTKSEWEVMFKRYFKILMLTWCKVYESSVAAPFYLGKVKK